MQVVLVYLEWFRRTSVLKCVLQPKIAKNSLKPPIFGVQGHSRSWMLVALESSSAVLAMIRSKYGSICNRFHAGWANGGKVTISKRGVPLFDALVRGEPSHPAAPNYLIRNERLWAIIWWRPGVSIAPGLGIPPGRDRRTDGQTEFPWLIRASAVPAGTAAVARNKRKDSLKTL